MNLCRAPIFAGMLMLAILHACASRDSGEAGGSPEIHGTYELPDGRHVGIDTFIMDSGERTLLYGDYQSRLVRRMFPAGGEDAYVIGPGFAESDPVEISVRVARDEAGHVEAIELGAPGESTLVRAARVAIIETEVRIPRDDATLAGTLMVPARRGPHPAIILLHGSGPLTRHSFGPYPHFFASLGFAVLVYDKRGTGASTGERFDTSVRMLPGLPDEYFPERLAADVHAAIEFLRGQPNIDADQIGLWGSSEGGMLATYVASSHPRLAFAINSSGFMGPLWETSIYQAGNSLRAQGFSEEQIQQIKAATRQWQHTARTGEGFEDMMAFRRKALADEKGWLVGWTPLEIETLEGLQWHWRHVMSFDPRPTLSQIRMPVLGLFGEQDPLPDAPDASRTLRDTVIAAGNEDVTVKVIPGAGHSLMEQPEGSRMAAGVFETLDAWLRDRVRFPR